MSLFGSWLLTAMNGEGMDQAGLARKLGVQDSLVSKWLNDKAKPSRRMTTKLCLLFKVPADWLLPLIDPEDVIELTDPPARDEKRAELLARLPALARLLDAVLALPLEKQATYIDLMLNLLPGLDRKEPGVG